MEILGYKLECTCGACPEQYDVFKAGELVGYLRLRHGYFTARFPYFDGEIVYEAEPSGDGIFEEYERMFYLERAIHHIHFARLRLK